MLQEPQDQLVLWAEMVILAHLVSTGNQDLKDHKVLRVLRARLDSPERRVPRETLDQVVLRERTDLQDPRACPERADPLGHLAPKVRRVIQGHRVHPEQMDRPDRVAQREIRARLDYLEMPVSRGLLDLTAPRGQMERREPLDRRGHRAILAHQALRDSQGCRVSRVRQVRPVLRGLPGYRDLRDPRVLMVLQGLRDSLGHQGHLDLLAQMEVPEQLERLVPLDPQVRLV